MTLCFLGAEFRAVCDDFGVDIQRTAPYLHHQLARIERHWRTISDAVTALLADADLAKGFWGYAFLTVAYVRNRVWHSGANCIPFSTCVWSCLLTWPTSECLGVLLTRIFSARQAVRNGCSVLFSPTENSLSLPDGTNIPLDSENGLYWLPFGFPTASDTPVAAPSPLVSKTLIHRRLCHLHDDGIRTISDAVTALLADADLAKGFWGYAFLTVAYVRNRGLALWCQLYSFSTCVWSCS